MPLGGRTIYRGEMNTYFRVLLRQDIPIARRSRDTPDGQFRLPIREGDHETRLKLKSITRVLENAEHAR
jgi:hypothetical protein